MKRTEIATLLEQLANGINPETGQPETGCRILESTRIIRALFNAATLLQETPAGNATRATPLK
jgi:hypothetical protein